MRILRPAFPAVLHLALATPAAAVAQTVTGAVIDERTGRPVPAAFVALLDSANSRVAGTLSDSTGVFEIAAPRPGSFRLSATTAGYRSARSAPFRLTPGTTTRRTFATPFERIRLDSIRAGPGACTAVSEGGPAISRLWSVARGALDIAAWTRERYLYRYDVALLSRILGRNREWVLRQVRDTILTRVAAVPFRGVSADAVQRGGYVRGVEDRPGAYVYYGPEPAVFLAPSFLDRHCFSIEVREDEPGLIGLAFRPIGTRTATDITGVFWIDRATASLERLAFEYTRLPWNATAGVAGGRVDFERVESGAWIMRRWRIRVPLAASDDRGSAEIREESVEVLRAFGEEGVVAAPVPGGTIIGTVYDSTQTEALRGATVYLRGTAYEAVTDSLGRFRLEGIAPGRYAVTFNHPILDIVGWSPEPREAAVQPGDSVEVALATASWSRILADGCDSAVREPGTTALVGFVRDAGTGIMVTEAHVAAAWPEGAGISGRAEAAVEPSGAYRLCSVPIGPPITLTASFGPRSESMVVVTRDREPVRRDIELFLESEGRLVGRVVDAATAQPIEHATVRVSGTELETVTDSTGRFEFDRVPADEYPVRAEHPDYRHSVASVKVPGRTTVEVMIRLGQAPIELDPITVVATRRTIGGTLLQGFETRRERGFGYFITREELEKRPPSTLGQVLATVPGFRISSAGRNATRIMSSRVPGCSPAVYIDGVPSPRGVDSMEFINYTLTDDIYGVEVYRGLSELPAEFADRNPACGAIVIWTRRGGT